MRGPNRRIGSGIRPAPSKGDIETYHEDGVWKNRAQGGQRASNTAETKAEAQAEPDGRWRSIAASST
ncbi:DUF2188 domain-containing protein [Mycobacteroides abscessus subsp. abscessus]